MALKMYKKLLLFGSQVLIWGANGVVIWWKHIHPEFSWLYQLGILGISLILCYILSLNLTNLPNAVEIDLNANPAMILYSPEERLAKRTALQLFYRDLSRENWAAFLTHCRDTGLSRHLADFAEITAHPTKRYCRFITQDFELKITGYDGKPQELVESRTGNTVTSDDGSIFQQKLSELRESLLTNYEMWMIDPVRALDRLTQLTENREFNVIFANLTKFAEIFNTQHFDCRVTNSKWVVMLLSTDQSRLAIRKRRSHYNLKLNLIDGEKETKVAWKVDQKGRILKSNLENPNNYLEQFWNKCHAELQESINS